MKRTVKKILALALCLCTLVSFAGAEGDSNLLESFTLKHGSRETRKVAFTIDDCYKTRVKFIEEDVELCRKYGIRMTFFPIVKGGCLSEEYRDVWQSVLDAGCEIGSHSYQHLYFRSFDYWTLIGRLGKWQEALDKTLGYHYQTRWLRPPYGNIQGGKKITEKQIVSAIRRYGYDHIIYWEVSETHVENALKKIQNGSILLFHTNNKDTKCMDKLIPLLQEQGYEIVTISELFGFDPPETSEELYVYNREDYEDK